MTEPSIEKASTWLASAYTRRSALGRALGVLTTLVAGSALPAVLPAARASALACPPSTCPANSVRNIPGTCWLECGRCCGTKMYRICDCCSRDCGVHNCMDEACFFIAESFHACLQTLC